LAVASLPQYEHLKRGASGSSFFAKIVPQMMAIKPFCILVLLHKGT
jgi:hypothetical protein